uniref:ATP synthase complex subunit 8 n=1 Tax=Cerithidea obtusa TaxID=496816 RepID=A0A3G3G501_9CAEN|nr:ATP synthase F0 subunit 8 [Cerithidea obtusa]AYQ21838.1 ATP synthase F0 subunit 8 [Cerithidea obtusa]
MPQLSPLNWVLLFVLFWFVVLLTFSLIWWQKKLYFKAGVSVKEMKVAENKWNW